MESSTYGDNIHWKEVSGTGIATLPNFRLTKARHSLHKLNLLVVGPINTGKRTFIHTLLNESYIECPIRTREGGVEHISVVKIIEGPNYMDETLETLTETMQECFENDQTTVGSMKSAFNPFPDPVYDELYHAVIFFIKPDKTNLSEKEVHWVKQIGQLAPVIPVISKADTLTGEELRRVKYQIRSLLKSVDLFDYAANDAECGYRVKDAIQSLSREWPFTIINPSSTPPSSASAHINFRNSETTSENSDTFKKDASDLFNRHKNNLKCSSDPRNTGLMDALKPATDNSSERKTRQTPWGNLFVRDHSDWDKLENFLFR